MSVICGWVTLILKLWVSESFIWLQFQALACNFYVCRSSPAFCFCLICTVYHTVENCLIMFFLFFLSFRGKASAWLETCITLLLSSLPGTLLLPSNPCLTKFAFTLKSKRPSFDNHADLPPEGGALDGKIETSCLLNILFVNSLGNTESARARWRRRRLFFLQHTNRARGHRVVRLLSDPWQRSEVRLAGCRESWKHRRGGGTNKQNQWFQETDPELFVFLGLRSLRTFPKRWGHTVDYVIAATSDQTKTKGRLISAFTPF